MTASVSVGAGWRVTASDYDGDEARLAASQVEPPPVLSPQTRDHPRARLVVTTALRGQLRPPTPCHLSKGMSPCTSSRTSCAELGRTPRHARGVRTSRKRGSPLLWPSGSGSADHTISMLDDTQPLARPLPKTQTEHAYATQNKAYSFLDAEAFVTRIRPATCGKQPRK